MRCYNSTLTKRTRMLGGRMEWIIWSSWFFSENLHTSYVLLFFGRKILKLTNMEMSEYGKGWNWPGFLFLFCFLQIFCFHCNICYIHVICSVCMYMSGFQHLCMETNKWLDLFELIFDHAEKVHVIKRVINGCNNLVSQIQQPGYRLCQLCN